MKTKFFVLLAAFLLFLNLTGKSQSGPCNGGLYPPACNERCDECPGELIDCQRCIQENQDAGVPIDGGLSWLLLSGIGLAAGRFIRKKNKNK